LKFSLGSFTTSLTLGFDASGPNDAIRKSYADTAYINSAGGTMTGALLLPATQSSNTQAAASVGYVQSVAASGGAGGLAGLQAQLDFPYPPLRDPKRDYGAAGNGTTDDSLPIKQCVAAALSAGERAIAINDTFFCPNLDWNIAQVLLIGVGQLIGANH